MLTTRSSRKKLPKVLSLLALIVSIISTGTPATGKTNVRETSLRKIRTIVIIFEENRSFDNLYGLYPGANGILSDAEGRPADMKAYRQLDRDGLTPLEHLPPVWNTPAAAAGELGFIAKMPNGPFRIDAPPGAASSMKPDRITPDLVHRFYNNQMQINGGRNNMFASWSDAGGLCMGYYDGSSMQMWQLARKYTLCDNFFMGAFGGSFLNHIWLISARAPFFPDAPADMKSAVDGKGTALVLAPDSPASALSGPAKYAADKPLTPDGYAVNTMQPSYQPSGIPPAQGGNQALADPAKNPLPPQDYRTIGDALSDKGVAWAWYSGAWNESHRDRKIIYQQGTSNFQAHHQPFNYFRRFDPTTPAGAEQRKLHLKDYADLQEAIRKGSLPAVVFYKPEGKLNQHPGNCDVISADRHVAGLVRELQKSPQWKNMAIIVTYDENGGLWDHVAPPSGDRWGPGMRIPAIVISPFARKHFVDHTYYDTTSILKFITKRFGLEPLAGVREKAGDLVNVFDFAKNKE